ncbi:fluoride efflux transporter FluC [Halobellus captivus]|uniref:fluoride efflux transporter FluC n=1 Tax=Halobellus captivus TaxID=2592614 RepID=UPI00119D699A|nr:CrcB family protein [Halobellus captivus]
MALLVGVGGSLGALGRYAVDVALGGGRRSTLAVNVLGSVALGALVASAPADAMLALVGTGFCGAFTTFSSFAVNVVRAGTEGQAELAAVDAIGTLAAALVGVGIGFWLAALW